MPASQSLRPLTAVAIVTAIIWTFLYLWQSQLVAPNVSRLTPFSLSEASATLRALLVENVPHPVGSDANKVIRDRIVANLRASGFEPEIQSVFQCARPERGRACAQLENVIAVLKGTGGGDAILATAHYDSVPAGPGAGDDGVGVAVMLELAKHLKNLPTPRNDVIFLIADAEEVGLLGATAFAEQHPLFKSVRTVLNLEARGGSGPSTMFETGPGNAALIEMFGRTVLRPVADSVAYEVYKLLPNDTDFSIYRRDGLNGFNFAFTGSASRYHSTTDNVALLDPHSFQHHGDNAFALAKVLVNSDLRTLKSSEDASYFDVFGRFLVSWPSTLNLPVGVIGLIAILGLIVMHRHSFGIVSIGWSTFVVVVTPLALFGTGWALSYPLGIWPGAHPLDHAEPFFGRMALTSAVIAVPAILTLLMNGFGADRRVEPRAMTLFIWATIAAIAVACAQFLPGATHAFVVPVLAFAIVAWVQTLVTRNAQLGLAACVGFVTAGFFWMSYFTALEVVFGFHLSSFRLVAATVLCWSMVTVFFQFFASEISGAFRAVLASVVLVLAFSVGGYFAVPYSDEHPRGVNITYFHDKSGGKPQWVLGGSSPIDRPYVEAQGYGEPDASVAEFGLVRGASAMKPAANIDLPAPIWTETARETVDGVLVVRGTLQAGRDGTAVGIGLPEGSGVTGIMLDGQQAFVAAQKEPARPRGLRMHGIRQRPVNVEFRVDPAGLKKVIFAESSALPDSADARALVAKRGPHAAPVHGGDGTIIRATVDLATAP